MATTATLAAVFVPISFLPGQAGRLFTEFGFTLAFAVIVSSVVALTLCPMLSIRLGRDAAATDAKSERGAGGGFYRKTLDFMLRAPLVPIGASIAFAIGAFVVFDRLPRELTPQEDRGRMFMMISGQEGANFNYLDDKIREIESRLQPLKESGEVSRIISMSGIGGGNRAFIVIVLPDWSEREFSQADIEAKIRPLLATIPGVQPMIRSGNSLGIRGGGQGLSFAVTGDDYVAIADAAEQLSAEMQKNPIFTDVRPNVRFATPQVNVTVDREAAAMLGVPISAITTTLAAMSDEYRAGRIFVGDDIVNIYISAGGEPVNDPTDLANLFVKTASGAFVPMSSVARIEETAIAGSLSREQRRRAAPVSAQLAEGVKISEAIDAMRAATPGVLDATMSTTLLGEARAIEQASSRVLLVFAFAALIVLLVLAAQFESFIAALIIMTTVPFGVAAAIYAMLLTGGSFNYYSQIGIILLIGVMAKNGILIVEFANKLRDEGASLHDAALEGAAVRLRPVLMTALSTLLGGLPLILGHGAGSEARAALGWVIIGGLGFSTLFTLYLTPVAFMLLARFSKPRATEERRMREELAAAAAAR
jgi:HAE1 family hydrophobic/amphiphilic exporter-1